MATASVFVVAHRFGFNGKEALRDWNSDIYDYGFRIYSAPIGRFLTIDPLSSDYPFYTPYQFASNSPILCVDIDGLEADYLLNLTERFMEGMLGDKIGTPIGQSNGTFNTFAQKKDLVDPREVAKAIVKDPIGSAKRAVGAIKESIKRTKDDLLSGNPERTAHALGATTGAIAEAVAPAPPVGKVAKTFIKPKLKKVGKGIIKELEKRGVPEKLQKSYASSVVDPTGDSKRVWSNVIPEGNEANHIFSGKQGKLTDTPSNRSLLTNLTNNQNNYLGVDPYGKHWFARELEDGTQLYGYTQDGIVKGGGVNATPRDIATNKDLTQGE